MFLFLPVKLSTLCRQLDRRGRTAAPLFLFCSSKGTLVRSRQGWYILYVRQKAQQERSAELPPGGFDHETMQQMSAPRREQI